MELYLFENNILLLSNEVSEEGGKYGTGEKEGGTARLS